MNGMEGDRMRVEEGQKVSLFSNLPRLPGIQALMAVALLACSKPAPIDEKPHEVVPVHVSTPDSYSSDRYPTVEDRKKYLLDRYGVIADFVHEDYIEKDADPKNLPDGGSPHKCVNDMGESYNFSYKVTRGDEQLFLSFMDAISRELKRYRPELLEKIKGLKILLAGTIIGIETGREAGGFGGEDHLVFSGSSATDKAVFHHELFHAFDDHFYKLCDDDPIWTKKTGAHRQYVGYKARRKVASRPPRGFARGYGESSEAEDQATMAESLMQPQHLKFLMLRAKNDEMLLTRIQLMTSCLVDTATGRFASTMTADEYKIYSGFDGYRYYHAWDPTMDHIYWNSLLNEVSSSDAPVSHNKYDDEANLLYYGLAIEGEEKEDFMFAGNMYKDAREPVLARKMFLTAAQKSEKNDDLKAAAMAYEESGQIEKAQAINQKLAEQAVAKADFPEAAKRYAKADKIDLAHQYALLVFEKMEKNTDPLPSHNDIQRYNDRENAEVDLWTIIENCYQWKNLPEIAMRLLNRIITANKGSYKELDIYKHLGDTQKIRETALSIARRNAQYETFYTADLYMLVGETTLAQEIYLKEAQKVEKKPGYLGLAADLYKKAGAFTDAQRCLLKTSGELEKDDKIFMLAREYRELAEVTEKIERKDAR